LRTDRHSAFGAFIAPHLDAAYNLARWLVTDEDDAADVVQDACLRAFEGYGSYRGGSGRAWVLTIVRNTAYNHLRARKTDIHIAIDDEAFPTLASEDDNPEMHLIRKGSETQLRAAIEALAPEYREAIVLRELEGMSYKAIAQLQQVPLGTIMSRLSRARMSLRDTLIRMEDRS
jgi:RNA polymerase sigma-70 factor (ECF subfamily)